MNHIRELHEKAMNLAEIAVVAKLQGDLEQANQLFRQAYESEAQAARLVPDETSVEPTRSILYRSAASLALDCNEFREAERLITAGLAGRPPEEIAEELRDLFEKANFQRHLDLRGVSLDPEEVQMSIAGRAISAGVAPSEEFIHRIEETRKLIYRTVERMIGKPYREGGAVSRLVRDYGLFVSVPRAASFAVSLRVSRPSQRPLPPFEDAVGFIDSTEVIDEILTCLELFNSSEGDLLRERIPEPAYYRNLVGIAKNIAPDGTEVNLVGFTTIRNGVEMKVSLTEPRDKIELSLESLFEEDVDTEREMMSITGRLLFADATSSEKQAIKLVDSSGKSYRIIVPEGMMSDIVRPLWEETVTVTGFYRRREIQLVDIKRASIG